MKCYVLCLDIPLQPHVAMGQQALERQLNVQFVTDSWSNCRIMHVSAKPILGWVVCIQYTEQKESSPHSSFLVSFVWFLPPWIVATLPHHVTFEQNGNGLKPLQTVSFFTYFFLFNFWCWAFFKQLKQKVKDLCIENYSILKRILKRISVYKKLFLVLE